MFFADASECISDDLICAVWSLVNQIVESITVMHILHLAEDSFYRIKIRAVPQNPKTPERLVKVDRNK